MNTAQPALKDSIWLNEYLDRYKKSIFDQGAIQQLVRLKELVRQADRAGKKVIFAGNGGSSAIASHCTVDFTKQAKIRSINFNEVDLITCYANDYGYEHWVSRALESYGDDGDLVILISSSGKSPNIINAARYAASAGMTTVTLTGFAEDNPLKQLGSLNMWVDSRAYNIVEMTHHVWLLAVCDLLVGKAEYPAS